MVYRSCGPYTLCGISSCFRLLSHTQRQIAHALLTRPPLICTRRCVTVRLECVMHAASVHPEPGSNSLKICISSATLYRVTVKTVSRAIALDFFYFEYYSLCFSSSLHTLSCFLKFCCSIFKDRCLSLPRFSSLFARLRLSYSTTRFSLCQALFHSFFKVFRAFFLLSCGSRPVRLRKRGGFSV